MKKSKIGEKGYHLIEEGGCVTLMYSDWYVLRFKDRMIEQAKAIQTRTFKVDDVGRVMISKKTF